MGNRRSGREWAMAGIKVIATNRRARHEYFIEDTFEAGIVLHGCEVKSLREARCSIQEAFGRAEAGEVWLHDMHITPWEATGRDRPDPQRPRKLLLHKREIRKLAEAYAQKGRTLIPLRVYFKDGRAKVELAICRGKKFFDKRQAIAERDAQRDLERELRDRQKG
jgi:SsrA-binding protein